MSPRTKTKSMSEQHKAALAEGRSQSRAVRHYLEALEAQKPKRGRKRSPESVRRRLKAVEEELATADALKRVQLVQEQLDLKRELEQLESTVDLSELEEEFVKAAKSYGERKGLTYAAWRAVGVPPTVLRRAGISRSD